VLDTGVLPYSVNDILTLAGRASYDRGVDYIDNVADMVVNGNLVTAAVSGRDVYDVTLNLRHGLAGDCDCPWGEEGNFCKHCVAVALIHLYQAEHGTPITTATGNGTDADGLDDYLASLDHADLVTLLLDAADRDPALRQRLELQSVTQAGMSVDEDRAIAQIDRLLVVDDYVEYRQASDYADRVADVTAMLAKVPDGNVVMLVQYALRRLAEAYNSIDDSSGNVGGAAAELADLHAQIVAETRPDPIALADWLLDFLTSGYSAPELGLESYADPLGEVGLAHYGEQVAARWHTAAADDPEGPDFQISYLMESWARIHGDVDLLITVLSTNRRYGAAYSQIVDALTAVGRDAEALTWAERGLADSGHRVPGNLVELVADRYAKAGRHDDVLTLRRDHFVHSRNLPAYKVLRTAAEAVDDWAATRAWALDQLRPKAGSPHPTVTTYYHNVLIDVLLWEDDSDAAWAAAHQYSATAAQWSRLAGLREPSHPEDAIGVYQRLITQKVASGGGEYGEAADLAVRVRTLYARIGAPGATEQGTAYLTGLRAAHKRKRNFMAELDRRGLP
jgi:uncharacterized Zn finger protein